MNKNMQLWLIIIIIIVSVVNIPINVLAKDKNQIVIKKDVKTRSFVGTIAIYQNGKLTNHYSQGYANALGKKSNNLNTMFEIDSIQKMMTGVLIMQQVEKHQLKLTDHLDKYFPSVPGSANITIRQMLNMTSGLSMDVSKAPGFLTDDFGIIRHEIRQTKYTLLKNGVWDYQPVNYVLLAGILEKVSHQSYRQLFTHQIIDKLKLKRTAFAYALPTNRDSAIGYSVPNHIPGISYLQPFNRRLVLERNELGTGQLYMSVGDLYRVVSAITQGKIIKQADVTKLYAKGSISGYGGGLYNRGGRYKTNGAGYGFEGTIRISKNGKKAVVILSNYEVTNMGISKLGDSLDRKLLK